jgi:flagellar biosynthetic protein FliR
VAYWLDQFHVFLLVLLRVGALLIVAPIFGHRNYLNRAKVGLALMVSLVLFPLVSAHHPLIPGGLYPYAFMMIREVALGLVLGYAVLLLFIGIQFAGQLAGLQMGLDIVDVIDPHSSGQISILGQYLNILAILILLTIDGHHLVLQGLARSFEVIPLGGVQLKEAVMLKLIALTSEVFVIAVKISAPVVLALFLVSVALGVLARTVPQMNILVVGFPVQLAAGLGVLVASLPLFYLLLGKLVNALSRHLAALLDFMS